MCITTYQPYTKSNPNRNPNPPPTTKKHAAVVNIQLNTVTYPTYPDKFMRDNVVAPSVLLQIVIDTLPEMFNSLVNEND